MRRWLAKKLYPEAFEAEDRLHFIRIRLSELSTWCGYSFPEIDAAIDWIKRRERIYFMSLTEYDEEVARAKAKGDWSSVMVGGISKFRDEISDRFDRRPERKVA